MTYSVWKGQSHRIRSRIDRFTSQDCYLRFAPRQSSINFARAHYPDRWLLTLHPGYVRFIAGMVMCLQFTRSGDASLLLVEAQTPAKLRKNAGRYENAPGCVEVHVSLDNFRTLYAVLRIAHESAIAVCLDRRGNAGGHRRAHSPGLVTYLDTMSGFGNPIPLIEEETGDREAIRKLFARTDIGPTEKQTLVNARNGQGLFRERVIELEGKCRVTGVSSADHLRASHIKPWKESTDQEKLDGNNGLLLAPHIDHLFDKGFISFRDNGDMLISQKCDHGVLEAWGISPAVNVGPFNREQCEYLAYHRRKFHFSERMSKLFRRRTEML